MLRDGAARLVLHGANPLYWNFRPVEKKSLTQPKGVPYIQPRCLGPLF